jgi:hypothetical protein
MDIKLHLPENRYVVASPPCSHYQAALSALADLEDLSRWFAIGTKSH